jgi:flagella basal body P-ring formation protein FlgA
MKPLGSVLLAVAVAASALGAQVPAAAESATIASPALARGPSTESRLPTVDCRVPRAECRVPSAEPALGVERTVPVATHALARGVALKPTDYQISSVVVRSALKTAVAAESGWVTRRPVSAGEPLVEPAVGPPALVTAGQGVNYVVDHEKIHLSIRGTAATAGALGDKVWVRMDSGRRLRGTVTAQGTVTADTTSLR